MKTRSALGARGAQTKRVERDAAPGQQAASHDASGDSPTGEASFARRIIAWQIGFGRHDLPWQATRDPYRIWLSEVMLQQTQVSTVIPYYQRFLKQFSNVSALAAAPLDRVMQLWSGLGYYSRARNLHRCAQTVVAEHGGTFPKTAAQLATLPGIGPSTAAAIASLAYGQRAAILDGNVKRVLARHFGVEGWPGERSVERMLWALAEAHLPDRDMEPYTQGLMDLGAGPCARARPQCERCPVADTCFARSVSRQTDFPGRRPARGVPERATAMLVMVHGGQVLLERRPPIGVWGGLLSLPEAEPGAVRALISEAKRRFGVNVRRAWGLVPLRHAFTHFKLRIEPVLLEVDKPDRVAAESQWLWVDMGKAPGEALAAPVRTLLASLAATTGSDCLLAAQQLLDDREAL